MTTNSTTPPDIELVDSFFDDIEATFDDIIHDYDLHHPSKETLRSRWIWGDPTMRLHWMDDNIEKEILLHVQNTTLDVTVEINAWRDVSPGLVRNESTVPASLDTPLDGELDVADTVRFWTRRILIEGSAIEPEYLTDTAIESALALEFNDLADVDILRE